MAKELEVLQRADFDWVVRLDDVWSDTVIDVPELQADVRRAFSQKLDQLLASNNVRCPLGAVMIGTGGTGKTHLLNVFRRTAAARNSAFVLVDMTDVRDFWETVLQGFLDSLQMPYRDGEYQYRCLLHGFLERLPRRQSSSHIMNVLAQRKSSQLNSDIQRLLQAIGAQHKQETLRYQDVVRAIACLNSDDFGISNLGMTWLQGQEIDPADQQLYGFRQTKQSAQFVVEALSWLMSLAGPTILAFDQLDPLVQQLKFGHQAEENSSPEQARSLAILLEVAGGLMNVIDAARRTQVVLSCIHSTWGVLAGLVMSSAADRFEPPWKLGKGSKAESLQAMVAARLAAACQQQQYSPPYPTWPFRPEAFAQLENDTPREVLKKCHHYKLTLLAQGAVTEVSSFAHIADQLVPSRKDEFPELTAQFQQLRREADPQFLLDERLEDDGIAPLLSNGLRCYFQENPGDANVDPIIEDHFPGGRRTAPLHARVRFVMHDASGREDHYCVRVLQHMHPRAYQARLNAAMTVSGIDPALPYRHLSIIRRGGAPSGAVTQKLVKKFLDYGGQFLAPDDEELRTLHALLQLQSSGHKDFDAWLRTQRPASQLTMLSKLLYRSADEPERDIGLTPTEDVGTVCCDMPDIVEAPLPPSPRKIEPPSTTAPPASPAKAACVQLGSQLIAGEPRDPLYLPVAGLEKHTVVLAGAGSGKTVFLRRLVEEVALCGVPAIVVDCANDLATFDERWPRAPEHWLHDDAQRADQFFCQSAMVVWTPGRNDGNPLTLQPIPDLAALADDPQELATAVAMVSDSLRAIVAPGTSLAANSKHGILVSSLTYFAQSGGGNLDRYIDLLNDLPVQAGLGVNAEQKLAKQIADRLKVEKATNPLLHTAGAELDPAVLFGDDLPRPHTRISVINFTGLPNLEQQRRFLNQLAMQLFSWIRKHPHPPNRPLRGLLVIDEARDFVPSQKTSVCKDNLIQLTAQARKYHLGLVFATQNPKDIDNKIITNCTTHVYGKANAPASIDVIKEQLQAKGGSGNGISLLQPGQFYVHNADLMLKAPVKVVVPMCLSRAPASPLEQSAILHKARALAP